MKEHLLYFLFFGIALAIGTNAAIDAIHVHFFAMSLAFQHDWLVLFVVVPALLLLALGWLLGFFRRNSTRWADGVALLIAAGLVYATLGAGYSCWHYCF
jgi:hypothetical protein